MDAEQQRVFRRCQWLGGVIQNAFDVPHDDLKYPSKLVDFVYPSFDMPNVPLQYMGREQFASLRKCCVELYYGRLVVLAGPRGCGKRMLALAVFCSFWKELNVGVDANVRINVGEPSIAQEDVGDVELEKQIQYACLIPYTKFQDAPRDVLFSSLVLTFVQHPMKLQQLMNLPANMQDLVNWLKKQKTILFVIDGADELLIKGEVQAWLWMILRFHKGLLVTKLKAMESCLELGSRMYVHAQPTLSDEEYDYALQHFNINVSQDMEELCGSNFKLLRMLRDSSSLTMFLSTLETEIEEFLSSLGPAKRTQILEVLANSEVRSINPVGFETNCFFKENGRGHCICKFLANWTFNSIVRIDTSVDLDEVQRRVQIFVKAMDSGNMRSTGWLAEKACVLVMSHHSFEMIDPLGQWVWKADEIVPFYGTFNWQMLKGAGGNVLHIPNQATHEAIDVLGEAGTNIVGWQLSTSADPEATHPHTRMEFLSWFPSNYYRPILCWIGDFGAAAPSIIAAPTIQSGMHIEVCLNWESVHNSLRAISIISRLAHKMPAKRPTPPAVPYQMTVPIPQAPTPPSTLSAPAVPYQMTVPIPQAPTPPSTLSAQGAMPVVASLTPEAALLLSSTVQTCTTILRSGPRKGQMCGRVACKRHK